MSGLNHVAGGVVFTGLFASLWNLNLFAKVEYLGLCSFFSVLPDIDHPRAPIGKLFYPIAHYLDRHFGHRTITHSLLAFILLALLLSTLEKLYTPNLPLALIGTLSYGSHLLFDMMTVEGVPLFYPFNRTPCVIPGNPHMRLKTGDFKTEVQVFLVFLLLGYTGKPLFEQGFWSSYNRTFSTLKHLHREFIATDQLIELTYDCTYLGQHYQGTGYLVHTTPQEATVFTGSSFLSIHKDCKIQTLLPTKAEWPYQTQERWLQDVAPEALRKWLHNKPILKLNIQANVPISYIKDNKPTSSHQVALAYVYNPQLQFGTAQSPIHDKLQALQSEQSSLEKKRHTIHHRITQITRTAPQMDAYTREKATQELKQLNKELERLTQQAHQHQEAMQLLTTTPSTKPLCSAYIQYLVLPVAP